jgi:hypothetical protein
LIKLGRKRKIFAEYGLNGDGLMIESNGTERLMIRQRVRGYIALQRPAVPPDCNITAGVPFIYRIAFNIVFNTVWFRPFLTFNGTGEQYVIF